mmetsp:Transcript_124917/g.353577  ORF Transcript_124917/g.353577 Transcript_124917/m.353577 type:complete len:392 (+) Transcript_124917:1462-2637(+)
MHDPRLVGAAAGAALHPAHDLVVAGAHQGDAAAGSAVARATARLLNVVLDALRHTHMDDGADVRLVQAHAEGHRCDDDARVACHEGVLGRVPELGRHASVVRPHAAVDQGPELLRERVGGDPPPHVHDGGVSLELLRPEDVHELPDLRLVVLEAAHLHDEVGPLHPRLRRVIDELLHREAPVGADHRREAQVRANGLDRWACGRGCECQHALRFQRANQELVQPRVVRPEVVRPLGDAVGLVDARQGDRGQAAAVERPHGQPLGGDEEDVDQARAHGLHDAPRLLAALLPAERSSPEAARQPLQLVGHQRHQWRDHQGEALLAQEECRQLVAERLACAGGEQEQRVLPPEEGQDRLLLAGAEALVPEGAMQHLLQLVRGVVRRVLPQWHYR